MKLGSASRLIIKMMDRFCYLGKICFNSVMKMAEGSQNCCCTCIFFIFSCSLLIKLKSLVLNPQYFQSWKSAAVLKNNKLSTSSFKDQCYQILLLKIPFKFFQKVVCLVGIFLVISLVLGSEFLFVCFFSFLLPSHKDWNVLSSCRGSVWS